MSGQWTIKISFKNRIEHMVTVEWGQWGKNAAECQSQMDKLAADNSDVLWGQWFSRKQIIVLSPWQQTKQRFARDIVADANEHSTLRKQKQSRPR